MDKPFRNLDEQIEILKSRNLKIEDPYRAQHMLVKYGYYSIINGYKAIFLNDSIDERFKENISFDDIIHLFEFDKQLRNNILFVLEDIESIIATNIAYIFSERFGYTEDEYLNPKNFKLGRRTQRGGMYERDILIQELKKIINKNEHPMKHYKNLHGNVPPWIMVKGATMGNFLYIYKLFKKDEKEYLISRCLGISINEIDSDLKEFFNKSLSVFRRFRNWAAHGGRMYSHKIREELNFYEPTYEMCAIPKAYYKNGMGKNDLLALCIAIRFFLRLHGDTYLRFAVMLHVDLERYQEKNPLFASDVVHEMGFPLNYKESLLSHLVGENPKKYLSDINYSIIEVNS